MSCFALNASTASTEVIACAGWASPRSSSWHLLEKLCVYMNDILSHTFSAYAVPSQICVRVKNSPSLMLSIGAGIIYIGGAICFVAFKLGGRNSLDLRKDSRKDHSRKDFTRSRKDLWKDWIFDWACGRNALTRGRMAEGSRKTN